MALIVIFVTSDETVLETVTRRRSSLVPQDIRADSFAATGGNEVLVSVFDARGEKSSSQDILVHLDRLNILDASGIIVLTDDSIPNLINDLGDQLSINRFVPPQYGQNVVNILSSILARSLRAFRYLKKRFNDLKYHQILRLPLRNFDAPEISAMRFACHDIMNQGNYAREIDRIMESFRKRQKPKSASTYPDPYYVDDSGKHFQFGPELHARADTKIPPHNRVCILANQFRFGCPFNGEKHYNVSREKNGSMAGDYPNCHGVNETVGVKQHLNMFTNDFF